MISVSMIYLYVFSHVIDLLSIMNHLKYEALISSSKTSPAQIKDFAQQIGSIAVSQRLKLLVFLQYSLGHHSAPHSQLNSALLLLNLLQQTKCWEVSIIENFFLEFIKEPALVAAIGSNARVYDYFDNKGYRGGQGNLQSLSYHFTHTCLAICLLVLYIKPKKFYKNKELNVYSSGKQIQSELRDKGLNELNIQNIADKHGFISLKKSFVTNVINFHKNPHEYIDFFMEQMESYFLNNIDSIFYRWFKRLVRAGDVYLSSEALARSAEVMCFHKYFSVRINALQLLSEFLFWGDLEALLLINYTDYFTAVCSKIIEAQERFRKTEIFCLFPEIQGQTKEKQQFLNDFLLCIQRVASIFPTLQTYFVDSGETSIYKLYTHLLKKQVRFPVWQDQEHFKSKVFKNFRDKREHNDMFLQQLDRQKREVSLRLNPLRPTMKQLELYCQKTRQNLGKIIAYKDINSKQWAQLVEFRKVYEDYLERMVQECNENELNNIIEECLYLENRIENIEQLSYKLKDGKISNEEFRLKIEDQTPQRKINQFSDKASTIKATLKNKDRSEDRYSLTPSAEVVKEKLSQKIRNLATKRGDQVGSISQLELYSRPFLANNIHGKDMVNDFLPILHLHPLRKEKRNRKGLKLLVGGEEQKQQKMAGTPRFNSEVRPKQKGKGIKLTPQQNKIYDKYLTYLDDEQIRKVIVRTPIKVVESSKWIIRRGQVTGEGFRLETTFFCICPYDISLLSYHINEQPWLDIKSSLTGKEHSQISIHVTAQFTKFGFNVPTIEFTLKQQKIVVPLPFALHNFLTAAPLKLYEDFKIKQWSIPHPLRPDCQTMSQIASQLKGLTNLGKQAKGQINLGQDECNLSLRIERGRLLVSIEYSLEQGQSILQNMLPRLVIHLFTNWKDVFPN